MTRGLASLIVRCSWIFAAAALLLPARAAAMVGGAAPANEGVGRTMQRTSEGMVESGFGEWLEARRAKGMYLAYDPDAAFAALERRLAAGEEFPLADA